MNTPLVEHAIGTGIIYESYPHHTISMVTTVVEGYQFVVDPAGHVFGPYGVQLTVVVVVVIIIIIVVIVHIAPSVPNNIRFFVLDRVRVCNLIKLVIHSLMCVCMCLIRCHISQQTTNLSPWANGRSMNKPIHTEPNQPGTISFDSHFRLLRQPELHFLFVVIVALVMISMLWSHFYDQ